MTYAPAEAVLVIGNATRQYTRTVIESVTVHMHSDRVSDSTHAQ